MTSSFHDIPSECHLTPLDADGVALRGMPVISILQKQDSAALRTTWYETGRLTVFRSNDSSKETGIERQIRRREDPKYGTDI